MKSPILVTLVIIIASFIASGCGAPSPGSVQSNSPPPTRAQTELKPAQCVNDISLDAGTRPIQQWNGIESPPAEYRISQIRYYYHNTSNNDSLSAVATGNEENTRILCNGMKGNHSIPIGYSIGFPDRIQRVDGSYRQVSQFYSYAIRGDDALTPPRLPVLHLTPIDPPRPFSTSDFAQFYALSEQASTLPSGPPTGNQLELRHRRSYSTANGSEIHEYFAATYDLIIQQ